MLKPRKVKTTLAITARYVDNAKGFPVGFAVYLGKKKLKYFDGNDVGEIIRPLTTKMEPIFGQPKLARVIYRALQTGFCKATIGMGAKYYGLRKLKHITKKKDTYIEELQESLFGKPDFSHIGINAKNDEGNTSTMDKLFKGGLHDGASRLSRKIANNPGISGAFANLPNLGGNTPLLTTEVRVKTLELEMTRNHLSTALNFIGLSGFQVKHTADVIEDIKSELINHNGEDVKFLAHLKRFEKILPTYGRFTLVDVLLKLPLFPDRMEEVLAASRKAKEKLSSEEIVHMAEPTETNIVEWLVKVGEIVSPKFVDYLGMIDGDRPRKDVSEMYDRVRKLAGINAGDEAVALDVAHARMIGAHLHDPFAISRALRNGERVLYMDTEMPIDLSKHRDLLVSTPDAKGDTVFMNMVKRREFKEGEGLTFDSLSLHPDVLKDKE